jgi:hypothetical protein
MSIATSLVELVQHCNNVEKSAKLYAVLGFHHSSNTPIAPDTASLLLTATASTSNAAANSANSNLSNSNSNNVVASGVVIRLLHVSASVKLPAPVPSTLLRCVVASPQSVVRDLIDSGWTRLVGKASQTKKKKKKNLKFSVFFFKVAIRTVCGNSWDATGNSVHNNIIHH